MMPVPLARLCFGGCTKRNKQPFGRVYMREAPENIEIVRFQEVEYSNLPNAGVHVTE